MFLRSLRNLVCKHIHVDMQVLRGVLVWPTLASFDISASAVRSLMQGMSQQISGHASLRYNIVYCALLTAFGATFLHYKRMLEKLIYVALVPFVALQVSGLVVHL